MPKFNLGKSLHGAMSRSTHGATPSGPEFYAQRHLMEEVTALRRKVKDLEDKEETLSSGNKTVDTDADDKELQEVMNLRKELNRVENEKAAMELDFMNQLSQMARDGQQQQKVEMKENVDESNKSDGDSTEETRQLKEDLASADKELEVTRRDVDSLQTKLNKLEAQKAALIEENTGIRLEVDNESKVITSLNDIMAENEQHFQSRIEKLENQGRLKDETISKKQQELNNLNEAIVKHDNQKAMLLEEITDLRLQLDRNDDTAKGMQKKLDELAEQQSGETTESVRVGSLKQAASDAEEKAEEMKEELQTVQNELRAFQKSHKGDVSRLEEIVATRNLEVEQAKNKFEEKDAAFQKLSTEHEQLQQETKELKEKFDEGKKRSADLEQEVATLESQRVFYEKRTSHCIMEQMTEADDANAKLLKVERQLKELEKELATQKETNEKLTVQLSDLKTKRPVVATRTLPPVPPLVTKQSSFTNRSRPQSFGSQSAPCSPSQQQQRGVVSCPASPSSKSSSVRALMSRFENNKSNNNAFEGKNNNNNKNTKDVVEGAETTKDADVKDTSSVGGTAEVTVVSSFEFSQEAAELQNRVVDLESQLEDARGQNEMLQQRLKKQSEQVGELHAEVAALSTSKAAIQSLSRKGFEKESEEYTKRIEELESELADARKRLEAESDQVETLKSEIREMTSERLAYEECTMQAYEKRAVTSQKTYQGEANNLRVELTSAQMKIAQLEKDHANQVKELEEAIEELNLECDKELETKQSELDMIKYKLDEQVDIATNLQREREQLCVQMNGASSKRRNELEEVQSELMERTAETQALQRAVQSLEMQVEHHTDSSRELEQLHARVRELESQKAPTGTAKHKQEFELERLEEQNRKLKDQVRNVTFERRSLQEKLNKVVAGQNEERTTNVLRERNEKLRREVERLNRKLQRKEGSISRIAI